MNNKSNFKLPQDVKSVKKELPEGGYAYEFHHDTLGLLGRLVIKQFDDRNSHILSEVAGNEDDPMTEKRKSILEPITRELTAILESYYPPPKDIKIPPPPILPLDQYKIECKYMTCNKCGTLVALLIFAQDATSKSDFENYARITYSQVVELNVPTWIIGPLFGSGPPEKCKSSVLKVWPHREKICKRSPNELNPIFARLENGHCRR